MLEGGKRLANANQVFSLPKNNECFLQKTTWMPTQKFLEKMGKYWALLPIGPLN